MDKNQTTGLLLIFLLLSLYFVFFAPEPPKQTQKTTKDTTQVNKQVEEPDSIVQEKRTKGYGSFGKLTQGQSKDITLENEDIKVIFSTKGAVVKYVLLKKYKTFDKKPVVLIDGKNSDISLEINTQEGKQVDIYKLFYEPKLDEKAKKITFRASLAEGKYIEQVYVLPSKGFLLDYNLQFKGLNDVIKNKKKDKAQFFWSLEQKRLEEDLYYSRYYATVNYSTAQGDYNYLNWPEEVKNQKIEGNLHWFSFKQKYFHTGLIAKNKNLSNAYLAYETPLESLTIEKITQASLNISQADLLAGKGDFALYFGPNDYKTLKKLGIDNYEENVHLGWFLFSVISVYVVIPLFQFLEGFHLNYGIIIILMVLIIKTVLLPLTYRSYKSMAKMKVMNDLLKPELDAFKEKNGLTKSTLSMEDQQKVSQEQMRLYKQLGSSPFAAMSGCIPMFLQMPIFIALFIFFPHAIELRQQGFLWASDLSTYDSILSLPFTIPGYGQHVSLFTLLMTASTIALTYFQSQAQANIQGPMKYMGYIFPVVFMFVLNSYPAGLSFYYLVQNVVSIGQQQLAKKYFIDESKIKEKFEAYKKENQGKDTKKSKLEVRLDEMQRKAQERAKQKKMEQQNKKR
jgi:YidC/Oxa1 family membrane protein insertase